MAAYNFQKQFAPAIESWNKRHTIRRIGKRHHSKPGDRIQLYTGMRTKYCRKIINPDPICLYCKPVSILVCDSGIRAVSVDSIPVKDLAAFALSDGFESLACMAQFWQEFHGSGEFHGLIVGWGPRLKSHLKMAEKSDWQDPVFSKVEAAC